MADGFIFFVNGKGPNEMEILMKKDYAKEFAQNLLEAIDRMDKGEDNILFIFKGQPLAQKNAILNEIKDDSKRIIVH